MNKHVLLLSMVMILTPILVAAGEASHHEQELSCRTCHECDHPTKKQPCLQKCPRLEMLSVEYSADESPEILVLDELSARYEPVVFTHRLHAEMANFSGGCEICHHHNPELGISPCGDCHDRSPLRADLSRPSLKGAYHRQCLNCHREWSHETKCAVCHALKDSDTTGYEAVDETDIIGVEHPPIVKPTKVQYETESDAGRFVTFYHDDHVTRFELSCVECHREESCSRCHDTARTAEPAPPELQQVEDRDFEEVHGACSACHEDSGCEKCHQESSREPFNHAVTTNWALGRRHEGVTCRQCHGSGIQFTRLDRECDTCHGDWDTGTFDHAVTGLALDENHLDLECEMCHADRAFSKTPGCDDCHDEKSYPTDRPGNRVSRE